LSSSNRQLTHFLKSNTTMGRRIINDTNSNKQYISKKETEEEGYYSLPYIILLYINMLFSYPIYSIVWCWVAYLIMMYMSGKVVRTLLSLYGIYMILDRSPQHGGWDEDTTFKFRWRYIFKKMPHFYLTKDYFPVELKKESNLDPSKNYLFLYHPHGVNSMGCNMALNTDACGFDRIFPGVNRSICTLNVSFWVPFFRELMLAVGFVSANRQTLIQLLTRKNSAIVKSVVLVPGGAAEALHAHPGIFHLCLRNRKGFIRIALETGCSLVPCIGFGENDIIETVYDTDVISSSPSKSSYPILLKLQTLLKNYMTFSLPIATHIFPRRKKLTVVVGNPIQFDCNKQEGVDECHQRYINAVQELYEKYKEQYGYGNVKLTMS